MVPRGSLHIYLHAHPGMDAAFEEMLALRKARDIKVATLKYSRPGNRHVFKAARALRDNACRAARVELRYESVTELFHLRKGVGLTALVDGKDGPLLDRQLVGFEVPARIGSSSLRQCK
jgi:hypothetical protein